MNDFEQDLARTDHLLSDVAATMYEVVQAWADEQLEWVNNLPTAQPITEEMLDEEYKVRQLQKIIDCEEQLAWLESLPKIEPLDELPEPDRNSLPPAGTPLDILPPPYNRHDWWKYTILKEIGEDVSNIYFKSQDYKELDSQVFEFVPSFGNYQTMYKRFNDVLTGSIVDGFTTTNGRQLTASKMRGVIAHTLNKVERIEFDEQLYPWWYLKEFEDIDLGDPELKRIMDPSMFEQMQVQILHVMFMNDGVDIDMDTQHGLINRLISRMIDLAIDDFEAGYTSSDGSTSYGVINEEELVHNTLAFKT